MAITLKHFVEKFRIPDSTEEGLQDAQEGEGFPSRAATARWIIDQGLIATGYHPTQKTVRIRIPEGLDLMIDRKVAYITTTADSGNGGDT